MVCMIGVFIFGVLYAEILNGFDRISYRLNPYIFGAIISTLFLVSEILWKRFGGRAGLSNQDRMRFDKMQQVYYICVSIIGFILLVMLPLIWWGAIKKLAESANKGIY
jgi:hypothetical protein